MIDRPARIQLAAAVREEFGVTRRDDKLPMESRANSAAEEFLESTDAAVRFVSWQIFLLRDDWASCGIPKTKEKWDYFQRLLLLLDSNSVLTLDNSRRWSATQLMAATTLVFVCLAFIYRGPIAVVTFPLAAVISILISRRRNTKRSVGSDTQSMFPFRSLRDLKTAVLTAPGFRKTSFPGIHGLSTHVPRHYLQYCLWLLFAPVVLLIQCGRLSAETTTVAPGSNA